MKKILYGVLMLTSISLVGCGGIDNNITKLGANISKSNFRVTQWSGGVPVKQWVVLDGYISTEEGSDGWFFKNSDGKLVRISGDVTIEEI